jgi:hypothetical protein
MQSNGHKIRNDSLDQNNDARDMETEEKDSIKLVRSQRKSISNL